MTKIRSINCRKSKKETVGILTDGDLKRIAQKYKNFDNLKINKVMTKNPLTIECDTLAASALATMNSKKLHHFVSIKIKKSRGQSVLYICMIF